MYDRLLINLRPQYYKGTEVPEIVCTKGQVFKQYGIVYVQAHGKFPLSVTSYLSKHEQNE
jgi:hypothetical protein